MLRGNYATWQNCQKGTIAKIKSILGRDLKRWIFTFVHIAESKLDSTVDLPPELLLRVF